MAFLGARLRERSPLCASRVTGSARDLAVHLCTRSTTPRRRRPCGHGSEAVGGGVEAEGCRQASPSPRLGSGRKTSAGRRSSGSVLGRERCGRVNSAGGSRASTRVHVTWIDCIDRDETSSARRRRLPHGGSRCARRKARGSGSVTRCRAAARWSGAAGAGPDEGPINPHRAKGCWGRARRSNALRLFPNGSCPSLASPLRGGAAGKRGSIRVGRRRPDERLHGVQPTP